MNEQEDNALWTLLDSASEYKASPMFTQNVLRAIRQEPLPWWKRLFASTPRKVAWSLSSALTVLTLSALVLLNTPESHSFAENDLEVLNDQELATLETSTNLMSTDETESALEVAAYFTEALGETEIEILLTYID